MPLPNGRYLAYVSSGTDDDEIYVSHFPAFEDRWQISGDGGTRPRWNGWGAELFYVCHDALTDVIVGPRGLFRSESPKSLFYLDSSVDGRRFPVFDVTAKGQRSLVAQQTGAEEKVTITVVHNEVKESEGCE
jgi:hypothetical protein